MNRVGSSCPPSEIPSPASPSGSIRRHSLSERAIERRLEPDRKIHSYSGSRNRATHRRCRRNFGQMAADEASASCVVRAMMRKASDARGCDLCEVRALCCRKFRTSRRAAFLQSFRQVCGMVELSPRTPTPRTRSGVELHSKEAESRATASHLKGRVMKKGDFVGGIEVRPLGGGQVMVLGGDPENWVCTWEHNGTILTQTFQPEQLERVSSPPGRSRPA